MAGSEYYPDPTEWDLWYSELQQLRYERQALGDKQFKIKQQIKRYDQFIKFHTQMEPKREA